MSTLLLLLASLVSAYADSARLTSQLAEKKIEEMKELVHKAHLKAPAAPVKKASGLTPEEEARLFGGKAEAAADPSKADYSRAWPTYFTEAEHKKLVNELRLDKKLSFELRRRLASPALDASAEDKEAYGELTALLSEVEKLSGDAGQDKESFKPLSPEDAFGISPEDLKR